MVRREDVLVPARFLLTVGHLVVVILAFSSQQGNVASGLTTAASAADGAALASSLQAALALSVISLAAQLAGLLSGATLLASRLNVLHCLLHFFGGVLTAFFVADQWPAGSFWAIAVIFNFLPCGAEVSSILLARQIAR